MTTSSTPSSASTEPPVRDGLGIRLAERGWLPDALVRVGIRRLCRERLESELAGGPAAVEARIAGFIDSMRRSDVAPVPEKANAQHYEVPADFYAHCLGRHRKYSSCFYPSPETTLDEAEAAALAATCERAGLAEGQRILELGCGWGSLTLWMAEHFPGARVVGVSNSASQREHILGEAARRGLDNVEIRTADMNVFDPGETFDRIVSVEMFEHMRNWPELFRRAATWLEPGGRMLIHVFCHRTALYAFGEEGRTDWMGRHFFSGGIMPSADLAGRIDGDLRVVERWIWDGTHYGRTSEDWLRTLDANRDAVMPVLERTYGARDAGLWFRRWRIFFLACAELFGYANGSEWQVVHWLLEPVTAAAERPDPEAAAPVDAGAPGVPAGAS